MPKQRRPSSGQSPATSGASTAIDPDVARFAAALKEVERREAEAKRKAAEERKAAEAAAAEAARVRDLHRVKDEAAARLRDARRAGRGVPEAEAAYKAALAAVVAAETGERPAWAPTDAEPSATEAEPGDDERPPSVGTDEADLEAGETVADAEAQPETSGG